MTSKKVRFEALDALRGLAILMMVLSAAVPFDGALPGWMYHAQLPPPDHVFNPAIPGITWVDLVFPMFLFSMGTAIPFSFGGRIDSGESTFKITGHLVWRFLGLALFAVISQHARPWGLESSANIRWVLALTAMAGMLLVFASPSSGWWHKNKRWMSGTGWALLIILFVILHINGIREFSVQYFDIIIMVLANTALGGGILYMVYRRWNNSLWIAFGLITAFFLGARDGDNWVSQLYDWSPMTWLISWNYLKYLIVLIPGIYTGIVVREALRSGDSKSEQNKDLLRSLSILILSGVIIAASLTGLYVREMAVTFFIVFGMLILLWLLIRKWEVVWRSVFLNVMPLSIVLILAGWLLEPLHGGIKKDPATLSYLMLTAGLSIISLTGLVVLTEVLNLKKYLFILTGSGKNAMMAYVAGSNLIMPVFALTSLDVLFVNPYYPVLLMVIKAILITLGVGLVSALAANKRLFMRV
ncbi:DUF5009 domain-containing protein [Marinilabilia salmonicolor]|uniref:DUF5009 domain-containing protein n=1 Tax=Marinilabilia salmonicolor TaxID=989 RepID=UPI00029A76BC|nr:DUF5009 domain-containing protein [Marinilabilia salmonicolor]